MRVIMLSCNTGEGHNSAAKAIQEALELKDVECELTDVLACLSPSFSKFICNWHVRIYKYGPKLFDVGYRATEKIDAEHEEKAGIYELFSLGAKKLRKLLEQGNYDAIICTHVFSGMMMTEVRKQWGKDIPCYFVSTDYTCYPYVSRCVLDGYFMASPGLELDYVDCEVPKDKLLPYGIPVRQAFYTSTNKAAAREKLNLPAGGLLLLVMCGSMGCGPIEKLTQEMVEKLPKGAGMVTICGRNEKLKEHLSEIQDPRLHVVGFTKDVQTYMDAADLLITKPGGLSSTEAANKHLPMVFLNTVGGCESHNFDFFLTHGYAVGSTEIDEVLEQTRILLNNPNQLIRIRRNLEEDFNVNGSAEIARHIIETVCSREKITGIM